MSAHRPIFIGGLSFTGKTQLRAMLSAHPNILIARRTHLWDRFYKRYGNLNDPSNLEHCLDAMLSFKHIRALHPEISSIRRELVQGEITYERLFAILLTAYASRAGKTRWGDQLTFIEYQADAIFAAYPGARMIQMVREPGSRTRECLATSSHRMGQIGWETAWWLRSLSLARNHQERYADRYLVVHYEQLFTQPEQTLRHICLFLDEPFSPDMLEHGDVDSHAPERQPPLPRRDRHFIQSLGWQMMGTFGYELDHGRLSLRDSLLYARDWPLNVAGFLVGMIGAGRGKRQFFYKEVPG